MASKSNQDPQPADAAASSREEQKGPLVQLRGNDEVTNPEPSKEEQKGPLA